MMPCQIKETQAAASHRLEYNAAELQEGLFGPSWHAGKKIPELHSSRPKFWCWWSGILWKKCTKKDPIAVKKDGPYIMSGPDYMKFHSISREKGKNAEKKNLFKEKH